MAELQEVINKYKNVPNDLKILKRWVCFKIVNRDGKNTKIPINAISGKNAKCNDQLTWTNFDVAIRGVEKYNCDGLGFMLGDGVFGIDLDDVEEPIKKSFTLSGGIVTGNCCVINLKDMLDNGTVINGKMVETPKSFQVACTVATQIVAQVASNQYGLK